MSYQLGVDLGTTYTAAAIQRDGRTSVVELGNRAASIPSVIFLREDETILTGEAANRRGVTEPDRIAREFKRRVGDPTPILVGGTPYSAESLSAKLLRWVVDHVSEREGGPPSSIAVTHPANWGPYKQDLLSQAIRIADLTDVATLTEPEAAAIHYAAQARVDTGSVVAVFDLGGGTFDAAILRKTDQDGFDILGSPEGIERLGGIDFDEAVFAHVLASTGGAAAELDPNDPAVTAAVARLRADCIDAKEALSGDTEATIPVVLPNIQTEVRLTRAEFEGMIRPSLQDALAAMRRAVRGAGVGVEEVSVVLLVGGSSRIPLVGQLVAGELGRPVAVDAHPKHSIALGAALYAARSSGGLAVGAPVAIPEAEEEPPAPAPVAEPDPEPAPTPPPAAAPAAASAAATAAAATAAPPPSTPAEPMEISSSGGGGGNRNLLIGGGIAALVVAIILGVVLAGGGGGGDDDGGDTADGGDVVTDTTAAPAETTEAPVETTEPAPTTTEEPVETTTTTEAAPTTTEFICNGLCARITEVRAVDGQAVVIWDAVNYGQEPAIDNQHAHFYWPIYEANQVGTNWDQVGGVEQGEWDAIDNRPFETASAGPTNMDNRPEGVTEICAVPADSSHGVINPENGACFPLPDELLN